MATLARQLLSALPAPLRRVLLPDPRAELLQALDASVLVFGSQLMDLQTGQDSLLADLGAETLAAAAAQLLAPGSRVALYLGPEEFVATSSTLPGVTRGSLASALTLQQEVLLPACEQALLLAVNADYAELGEDHIALWLPQARLDELYAAFATRDLFLAALRPRLLVAAGEHPEVRVVETSAHGKTAVSLNQGVLMQWLQVPDEDLQEPHFEEQWQQELKSYPAARTVTVESLDDYRRPGGDEARAPYWFFPEAAVAARRSAGRGRQLAAAAIVVVAVAVLAALPFVWQSLEFRRAAAELAEVREQSAAARADQAVVANFENQWGPVNDYPRQNLREALFTLQETLSPDRLSSLELSEGLMSIEGTSEDPQAILQRLEQNPLFTEVAFARATNNTRYYIDLRLSPVNFEGYRLRYFPDQ